MSNGKINFFTKFFLSVAVIGIRSVRWAISSSVGGGTFCKRKEQINSGIKKSAPVTDGIQNSLIPQEFITKRPTDFTTPLETIKLAERTTPKISVNRLPSIYENTIPQIIPKGKPLRNIKGILYGAGTQAKSSNEISASTMSEIR